MFTTTIHETPFRLVLNILRPQFSNDCNSHIFDTLRHRDEQKPNRTGFIITHIQAGPQYFDVSYFRLRCDYNPTPRLKTVNIAVVIHLLYLTIFRFSICSWWMKLIMRYTRQAERDSTVRIRVLTACSWSQYSPCSTNTIYKRHATLATNTPATDVHFQHQTSAPIYDSPTNAQSCIYTVTTHLNIKNSYTVASRWPHIRHHKPYYTQPPSCNARFLSVHEQGFCKLIKDIVHSVSW